RHEDFHHPPSLFASGREVLLPLTTFLCLVKVIIDIIRGGDICCQAFSPASVFCSSFSVSCKYVFQIKICLLVRLSFQDPVFLFIQIREICIRVIGMVRLCHISLGTVREHHPVNALPSDHIDTLIRILLQFLQKFLQTVYYNCSFYLIMRVSCKDDIRSVLQRLSARKAFQCLSAHNNHVSCCCLPEKLHICRDADKQLVFIPDSPVFVYIHNQIHLCASSSLYRNRNIFNLRSCRIIIQTDVIRRKVIEIFYIRVQPEFRRFVLLS